MNKILLIEDDYDIRKSTEKLLEKTGFSVSSVEDGESALKIFSEINPNLILCDIKLPGISGYEVLENLYELLSQKLIPFIFISAKKQSSDLRKGMLLGADDYIFKPFTSDQLLDSLMKRMEKFDLSKNIRNSDLAPKNKLFVVSVSGKTQIIKHNEILKIKAENQYSEIHKSDGEKILTSKSLKYWENKLESGTFMRINRSIIVNTDFIQSDDNNKKFEISLTNSDEKLTMSRRYYYNLKKS